MAISKKDGLDKPAVGSGVQEESHIYEDEINLIDYFVVLWKRKWFIFFASVLPCLFVGMTSFLWPRSYQISYVYNMRLDEKGFKILEDEFYSTENLEKISSELQAKTFKDYAKMITDAKTTEDLRNFISFQVLPSYFEAIDPSKAESMEELEKLLQAKGNLLILRVKALSNEHIREIALVCRNNFEQIIPLYSVREELNSNIISLKQEIAAIEGARYMLNMELERKKSTLEYLKKTGSESFTKLPSDITLQFNDVGAYGAYLPLAYQVQAAETLIINLQEQVQANKEKYDYYNDLLKLNESLLIHIDKSMSSYYTLGQFGIFLSNSMAEYKEDKQQMQDYLKAYIYKIENKIASATPLVEKPKVYTIAKGMVKKSVLVFVAALMLSMFVVFLLEGVQKKLTQTY
ncbi:MAG TPA: hypothetical protein PLP05_01830 [Sedimentisphaerales bacterium]|nr:hypothetical protein [Sedimentisphaerales bacterium]